MEQGDPRRGRSGAGGGTPGPGRSTEAFLAALAPLAGRVVARAPDGGRQPGAAPPKPHAQARLQHTIAEESLDRGGEAREWARRKIGDTAGAPTELCTAAELGEEWTDVMLDDEELLRGDLVLAIRATLQGPARGAAACPAKGFQDDVDITMLRRVKTKDIS